MKIKIPSIVRNMVFLLKKRVPVSMMKTAFYCPTPIILKPKIGLFYSDSALLPEFWSFVIAIAKYQDKQKRYESYLLEKPINTNLVNTITGGINEKAIRLY